MSLITSTDLIAYSVFDQVRQRDSTLLENDIMEAQAELETIVGHDYSDPTKYPTLPDRAKLALLKLAQFYSLVNSDESMIKGILSEKLGDYSYTMSDGTKMEKPDVAHLIINDVQTTRKGRLSFRIGGI